MMEWFAIILLGILLIVFLSIVWTTLHYGIGPAPTSAKVKKQLFSLLPHSVKGPIYELGAGWGTLAFPLADHYPDAQVNAIEISPIPWLWMKLRNRLHPRRNLNIIYGNFFHANFQNASLIVCYLYPQAMTFLEKKFQTECSNTWIATHTFALPHLKPTKSATTQDLYRTPIYLYKI